MVHWQQVELGDAVVGGVERAHYTDVVAYGHGPGAVPFAAVITPGGAVTTLELPGAGPVSWAAVSEALEFTVGQEPPLYVVGGGVGGGPFSVSGDVDLADVVRLWPVCGDEDPQVVVVDRAGRVTVVDVAVGNPPEGEGLWLATDDLRSAPVVVGQSAVEALVAGRLRGGQQEPGVQLWISDFYRGWVQVPAALLDGEHPQVCVAYRGENRVVLALQTERAGRQLWLRQQDQWTAQPLPRGRLRAARVTGGEHAWVVIDGHLWHGSDLWS